MRKFLRFLLGFPGVLLLITSLAVSTVSIYAAVMCALHGSWGWMVLWLFLPILGAILSVAVYVAESEIWCDTESERRRLVSDLDARRRILDVLRESRR